MGKVTLTSLPPDKNPRLPRLGNYPKWIKSLILFKLPNLFTNFIWGSNIRTKLDKVLCHKTSWIYFTLDTEKYNNNVSYNNNLVNNGLNQLTRGIPTGSRGRGNLSVRAQSIEREYKQMGKVTLTMIEKGLGFPKLFSFLKSDKSCGL